MRLQYMWMCAYVCVCVARVCAYACTSERVTVYVCERLCVCVCVCVCVSVCLSVSVSVCVCAALCLSVNFPTTLMFCQNQMKRKKSGFKVLMQSTGPHVRSIRKSRQPKYIFHFTAFLYTHMGSQSQFPNTNGALLSSSGRFILKGRASGSSPSTILQYCLRNECLLGISEAFEALNSRNETQAD